MRRRRSWFGTVMAVALVAALATFIFCSPSHAGDFDAGQKIDWLKPVAFHGGIHGADYWSSVTSGGVEVGPVASRVGLRPTKVGGFLLTYGADVGIQKLQGSHRWPVRVYRIVLFAGYGFIVARNRSIR